MAHPKHFAICLYQWVTATHPIGGNLGLSFMPKDTTTVFGQPTLTTEPQSCSLYRRQMDVFTERSTLLRVVLKSSGQH